MNIDFQQGIITYPGSGSLQSFLTYSGGYVSLSAANGRVDFTVAYGAANYLFTESLDVDNAWGPLPSGTDCWLYWDINLRTAERTFGFTTVQPVTANVEPSSPQNGQMWFDPNARKMYEFQATSGTFHEVLRVFAAKVNGSTFTPAAGGANGKAYAGSQAGLVTSGATAGRIFADQYGNPIRQSDGTFLTTESTLLFNGSPVGAAKLDSSIVPVTAGSTIAEFHVVSLTDFDKVSLAAYTDTTSTTLGIALENINIGEVGSICLQGIVVNPAWTWTTPGASLWVSAGGVLTETDPHVTNALTFPEAQPPVARVFSATSVVFSQPVGTTSTGASSGSSSTYRLASADVIGAVRLSTNPSDLANPIAVSDNDPRLTNKVAKAGDVMTGPLILSSNPVVSLGAATKQYVDTAVQNTDMSSRVAKAGDTMTGALILSGNPSAPLGAATKQYVDTTVAAATTLNIPALPNLAMSISGTELLPVSQSGVSSKFSLTNLGDWLISHYAINRPPTGSDIAVNTTDTAGVLTGNLYTGITDPDGDTLVLQSIGYTNDGGSYTAFDPASGSIQMALGILLVDPANGAWTFTLGQGALALNTGDVAHEIITYVMSDNKGGIRINHLTITITGTNQAPIVSFVNGGTPVNTTVSGNLIYRLAFDYETTPSITNYSVAGMTGTFTGTTTITDGTTTYGSIAIASDGTWSFVPAHDYVGPVPTVTYNVTDGVNIVPSFLTLAVSPLISGSQPQILGTDVVAGPISGGENDLGQYLTIFGRRFGPNSGIGTDTKVYIGGVEVAQYMLMADDQLNTKFSGLQRISVRVGPLGNPTLGEALHIKVTYGGQDSNQDFTFTPNPGRFLYVSHAGNDSTAVVGDINFPFRMLQYPTRTQRSVYTELQAGDTVVIMDSDGQPWSDLGYNETWFRFRDPQQQGSAPTGQNGTGWITFMGYPGQNIHYITPTGGHAGGIQGPGSAFTGTCGDWVVISNLHMEVPGGSRRDAGPVNMQYNAERWRIVGNNLGPWVGGSSDTLNCACISGEGNFIYIAFNKMHDVDGTVALQNHGIYAGTNSYGWEICFNWIYNMTGGSLIQFNDSDGGTNLFMTPYGVWTGFTNIKIHHNWLETSAKYGINFADIANGAGGELDFLVWNNIIVGTGLAPFRLNTHTATSDCLYAFNTVYDCVKTSSNPLSNGFILNDGDQPGPTHVMRAYNNVFACGPNTTSTMHWATASSDSNGSNYDLKRNLYFANGRTVANDSSETMGVYGDPLFTSPGSSDYTLQAGSPAVNAGTYSLGSLLSVQDDYTAMNTRQYGGAPDIGALERAQTTPFVISAPTFSGGPQVGVPCSVNLGSWGNSPTGYVRDFRVNGVSVSTSSAGSGSVSYTPVAADIRQTLTVIYTATNGAGSSQFTLTVGTIAEGVGGPVNTVLPVITGTPQVGVPLTCSTGTWSGTNSGYTYQWYSVVGSSITVIAGATSNTYTPTNGDYNNKVLCEVQALNTTTGSGIIRTAQSATVLAGIANPSIVQVKSAFVPSNTNTTITFDNPVSSGNWVVFAAQAWDNAPDNSTISDTQGHIYGAGGNATYTLYARAPVPNSNNPNSQFGAVKLTAGGTYTTTYNSAATQGSAVIMVEIANTDISTLIDVAQSSSTNGSSTSVSLTASSANTKATDLTLVLVSVPNTTGAFSTFTQDSGWTLVGQQNSTYATLGLFSHKSSSIETVGFTTTISNTNGWAAQTLSIKGA